MKINKKFSIERDAHNFIVVERKKNKGALKDGKRSKPKNKYRELRSYYPTMLLACSCVQKKSIDTKDVKTITDSLDKATKQLVKAIKKMESK